LAKRAKAIGFARENIGLSMGLTMGLTMGFNHGFNHGIWENMGNI
jgi:hypothetical protein